MALNWGQFGQAYDDIASVVRALAPGRSARVLYTGSEEDDRLILALAGSKALRIDVVPAHDKARKWLANLDLDTVNIREIDASTWRADPYDIVACASPLKDAGLALMDAEWLSKTLLKDRGYLLMHGAIPARLEPGAWEGVPESLAQAQTDLLAVKGSRLRVRPGPSDTLKFEGWCPRKPETRSYVAWLAFSKRRSRHPAEPCANRALVLAQGLEAIVEDLPTFAPPQWLGDRRIDRLVFVNNDLTGDPRVVRALMCADHPAGRALGVSRGEEATDPGHTGPAILGLPDHRERIGRRLRLAGIARSRGVWRELASSAMGRDLARLIEINGGPNPVLHTHDMDGVILGATAAPTVRALGGAWVHDVHEYAAGYDGVIDVKEDISQAAVMWEATHLPSADAVVTVSPLLGEKIATLYGLGAAPQIVLNAIDEGATDHYEPCLRSIHDLPPDAPLLLHVGSLRPGRGLETAIGALKDLDDARLVCVGGGAESYLADLRILAAANGVSDRFCLHGHAESRFLISLSRQADIGLVPTDSYGNAEVSLPNKLFIYAAARLPVVSTTTAEMARFVTRWRIGRLCPPGDPAAMAAAIADALRSRADLKRALEEPTFAAQNSWTAQCRILTRTYADALLRAQT